MFFGIECSVFCTRGGVFGKWGGLYHMYLGRCASYLGMCIWYFWLRSCCLEWSIRNLRQCIWYLCWWVWFGVWHGIFFVFKMVCFEFGLCIWHSWAGTSLNETLVFFIVCAAEIQMETQVEKLSPKKYTFGEFVEEQKLMNFLCAPSLVFNRWWWARFIEWCPL